MTHEVHENRGGAAWEALIDRWTEGCAEGVCRTPSAYLPPICVEEDPTHIARFELLEILGRGGQAVVWKARDPECGRLVALKVLGDEAHEDVDGILRMRREVRLGRALLGVPGVVQLHDTGWSKGGPWIALRYIEGETLAEQLGRDVIEPEDPQFESEVTEVFHLEAAARAPRPVGDRTLRPPRDENERARRIRYVRDLAHIVARLHERGITHRDLKPENVLIDAAGQVHLLDLGLADDPRWNGPRIAAAHETMGTPHYMAPEQFRAAPRGDPSVDVWALGVILYEAVTGARPFGGRDVDSIARAVMNDRAMAPRDVAPDVPTPVARIIKTALRRRQDRRFEDAAAFAAAMDGLLEGRRAPARRASALAAAAVLLPLALLGGSLSKEPLAGLPSPAAIERIDSSSPPPVIEQQARQEAIEAPLPTWIVRARDLLPSDATLTRDLPLGNVRRLASDAPDPANGDAVTEPTRSIRPPALPDLENGKHTLPWAAPPR